MNTNGMAVPKKRFPGFSGEWPTVTISKIANKITDGTHDTPKPTETGVPFITAIHVKDGFIDFANCYYLPEEEHRKIYARCNPEKDDLLMVNIGAGTATSALVEIDYEFGLKNVALIKPNRKLIDPRFFSQFQRYHGARLRHQLSSGGAQPFLSLKQIGQLQLQITDLREQRKIADFLTAVDGRIQQLSQKKALLEDYKKGVMQQLFTQALRFKDDHGNDFPDWEEKTLGDLSNKVGSGKTPTGGEKVYQTSGVKFIRSQNVSGNRLDLTDVTFISEAINAEMKGSEVRPLDVLLNITGASIGRTCIVPEDFDRGNVNQHVCIIRLNRDALNPFYLQMFLSSSFGQQLIDQSQSGSGREGLNFKNIRAFNLPIPSLPEQTKIANFLTALDRKIESVAQQIAHTQDFKKGLLQQMFV